MKVKIKGKLNSKKNKLYDTKVYDLYGNSIADYEVESIEIIRDNSVDLNKISEYHSEELTHNAD